MQGIFAKSLSQIPAILYYQRTDVNKVLDFSALEVPPDESILTADVSTARYVLIDPDRDARAEGLTFLLQKPQAEHDQAQAATTRRDASSRDVSIHRRRICVTATGRSGVSLRRHKESDKTEPNGSRAGVGSQRRGSFHRHPLHR